MTSSSNPLYGQMRGGKKKPASVARRPPLTRLKNLLPKLNEALALVDDDEPPTVLACLSAEGFTWTWYRVQIEGWQEVAELVIEVSVGKAAPFALLKEDGDRFRIAAFQ